MPSINPSALAGETIILFLFGLFSAGLIYVLEQISQREAHALAERQHAELQYRTIFEGALDGIYQASPEGQFLAVNQAMVDILGYDSKDELLSESFDIARDFYVESAKWKENLELLKLKGMLTGHLIHAKRKDGSQVWLSTNISTIEDRQGKKVLTGLTRDVTEAEEIRHHVEAQQVALQQSEHRNRAIIDTIPDIMIWYSAEGEYLEVILRDWYKPMGTTNAEDVIGQNVSDVLPPESANTIMKNLRLALETGETQTYQFGPTRHNQYLEGRATPSADGNILVTSRDITQEVQAGLALKRRDTILSAIGFSTEQLLRTTSWQDVIEPVLQRLGEASDVSRTYIYQSHTDSENELVLSIRYEWAAPGIDPFINDEQQQNIPEDGFADGWCEQLRAGKVIHAVVSKLPQGDLRSHLEAQSILGLVLVPINVGEEWWGFIGLDDCVIEREWSEQEFEPLRIAAANIGAAIEREQTQKAFLEIQKSESIGVLAGGIAHDFNNLLTGVIGQSSLAEAKLEPEHPAVKHLGRAVRSAKQAANLTKQLLAYAGKGQVAVVPIDLNDLVTENIELFTTALPATVTVHCLLDAAESIVVADKVHMQQLIMNLFINAGDAMSDGGQLTITSKNEQLLETMVDTRMRGNQILTPGNYFVLVVADTGIGMSEATVAKIFDPYFSTKESGQGLGLAATLGIVNTLGGSVRVQTEIGEGTTFVVWLPVDEKARSVQNEGQLLARI